MNFVKITVGYVRQTFNDRGQCIKQEFIANDEEEWETDVGDPIDPTETPCGGEESFPLDMVQPQAI